MKNLSKSLLLLSIILLSACQAAKLAEKSAVTGSSTQSTTPVVTNQNILLQMNGGTDLQVQANPTPIPTATPKVITIPTPVGMKQNQNSGIPLMVSKMMSFLISDASAASVATPPPADTYQIYDHEALINKLSGILGSDYPLYQEAYASYLSTEGAGRPVVPAILQKDVTISFTSANGKVTSLTLSLVKVLAANSAVITYGTNAYYGIAGITFSASSVISFRLLLGGKFYKVGSVLKLVGGLNGTTLNRSVATITFSGTTFSVSTLAVLPVDTNLKKVESRFIDSSVANDAGFATTHVGKYLLLYYINSLNKVYQLALLDVSSNVISTTPATCASVLKYITGYTCSTKVALPN